MQTTDNYGLKVYEGADLFNPLTVENPNTEAIDLILKAISEQAIGTATELTTGTVHALTRSDSDQALFRFTATSNFVVGDTFTVDTIQVSALTINGQALPDGAYLAGAEVLCALVGTRLTVYGVTGSNVADDSLKLGGELPSYYGKATDVTLAQNTATAAGTLATQLDGRVLALETAGYLKPVTLWSNPDTSVAFTGQPVNLSESIDNCEFFEITYAESIGGYAQATGLLPKNVNFVKMEAALTNIRNRKADVQAGGSSILFSEGTQYNTYGTGTVNNNIIIPISVIGFKK